MGVMINIAAMAKIKSTQNIAVILNLDERLCDPVEVQRQRSCGNRDEAL
jgi:hypothetical protein